jgi:HD-GYP domain-containing protein (c-di-GMP phosphodiesterase class II)
MELKTNNDQLDRELIKLGKALVTQFFVLCKTALHYKEGHAAIDSAASRLLTTIKDVQRLTEDATISVSGGHLLFGEFRLRPDAAGFDAFMYVLGLMKRYYVGSITFHAGLNSTELGEFPFIFQKIEPIPAPQTYAQLVEELETRSLINLEVTMFTDQEVKGAYEEEQKDSTTRATRVYFQTMQAISEVMEHAKLGQTLKLRKSKRVVQGMIDEIMVEESTLLGLTTIRCHDEYTYNHSVNVCILSLTIGHRLGLHKETLCELGMAALFHDIGKADIPLEVLNKPDELSPEEWEVMRVHPVAGVKKLMKLKGLDTLCTRIISGAYEHHINYDFSGYPKIPYKHLSLFGKIIKIADCYDAITSSRVYRRTAYPPDKVLGYMMTKSGTIYDPVLLKLLINCVGIYAIGSLLLLNTKELAVVIQNNPDPNQWKTPRVKIITDQNGEEIPALSVDLGEDHSRSIAATLDANHYKFNLTRYFF